MVSVFYQYQDYGTIEVEILLSVTRCSPLPFNLLPYYLRYAYVISYLIKSIPSSFSSIVRSGRYVRSVNILVDAKCLVSIKCLPTGKSLPSAKSLATTKCLAFANFLVIDKHVIDKNLSNMTEMSSSNIFWSKKINHSQVVIFFKTK